MQELFKWTDRQYALIKWAVAIAMPAIGAFIGIVGTAVNWELTELVLTIWTAFTALLGTCLGVSSYQYNKEDEEK